MTEKSCATNMRGTKGAPLNDITAVLFDLDGTVIDTYNLILSSMRYTMRQVLHEDFSDERLMRKVGQPLATQMWDYTDSPDVQQELLAVYREHNKQYHDTLARVFEGTEESLKALQELGYPLGIVTSKRHGPALQGLQLFGLDGFFEFIIGSDDTKTHKPDPGPILYGAELLGVDARSCLYVGDSPYDIQAGNAAGATTVAALWGMFPPRLLVHEHPAYCCETIRELPALLRPSAAIA